MTTIKQSNKQTNNKTRTAPYLIKISLFHRQLGLPLSYRFLRRYGKVANVSMETLTLSRFILEMSLMDYSLLQEPESKIAAATLLLAMR